MTIHTSNPSHKIHQGRNVKRFREMLGVKQDALAFKLGNDWNQQKVSLLEQKETIEVSLLQQISAMLNALNHNPTFHPIDTLVQLHEEKIALYERMLKEKDEMMGRLERLIEGK